MLAAAIARATRALLERQQKDGHWVFDLEADATIPAEYVLLRHYLGDMPPSPLEARIGAYLRRTQGDHGGWPLFHGGAFDMSASVKAYFALKAIGDDPDAPHMARARAAIRAAGGAARTNVFTRVLLALYGCVPWSAVPTMPVELMLLPRWFPFHISKISYWARTVLVPLTVIMAHKPKARNPRGVSIDELFVEPAGSVRHWPAGPLHRFPWTELFGALDKGLKRVEPLFPAGRRARAIAAAVAFVDERLNGEDGLGGIFPAMAYAVMMYDLLGVPADDPRVVATRTAIEKLLVIDDDADEAFLQPCVSPVWDTALTVHALVEDGSPAAIAGVGHALSWIKDRQVLDVVGDWADARPTVRPGGWAFQYANPHYPDLDDTAVVVMALDRAAPRVAAAGAPAVEGLERAIDRGAEWVVGMQCRDGGWGAFDADNTYEYLNYIPFADHGALLDPPTADVTARCVGMLAQLGPSGDAAALRRGIDWLLRAQEQDGSWFGRWGVNYIYGTWSVLCGLNAAGLDHDHPAIRRATDWLIAIQNADGGWGEDCESYALGYRGYRPFPSTPSQTAWALLALMAAGRFDVPSVARGVSWLLSRQEMDGLWSEDAYNGTGFPRVFYLRYHGYAKLFPLWALARYRNLQHSNSRRVAVGL